MANNNYKKSGRGKKPYTKDKKERVEDVHYSGPNDISFHAKDDQLLKDAASLAYAHALGTMYDMEGQWTGITNESIPGVYALVAHPTIGRAHEWSDPINIASRSLYSWIRHANSGHANYDAPDLAMYIIAMGQLDSAIEWAKRLYGFASSYSYRNRYTPRALIEANGVDFTSLSENLANYRAKLNQLIDKRTSLAVPKTITYYKRCKWLYSGAYKDHDDPKGQIYEIVPDGFYYMDIQGEATALKYHRLSGELGSLPENKLTWEQVIALLTNMIDAIWNQEDYNIMSGDIIKAYGEGNLDFPAKITEDYSVQIVPDLEVMSEIQNATVIRCDVVNDTIYQNTDIGGGEIKCDLELKLVNQMEARAYQELRMITVPTSNPTPADNMIATRWTVIPDKDWFTDEFLKFTDLATYGTEIIVGARVCNAYFSDIGQIDIKWYDTIAYYMLPRIGQDYTSDELEAIGLVSRFSWHPAINVVIRNAEGEWQQDRPTRLFEVDNFTIVDREDLQKMHSLSVWTQFSWA